MKEAKSIFDYLDVFLRYFISGFISIFILAYIDDSCLKYLISLFRLSPWIPVVICACLGILTYSIHQALLDKIFYELTIKFFLCNHKLPNQLENEIKNRLLQTRKKISEKEYLKKSNIRFSLFSQSYLRKSSQDKEIISIQAVFDKKLAILNFLYCTFYSLFILSILIMAKHYLIDTTCENNCIHKCRVFSTLFLSIGVFVGAFYYDYRTTEREMWIVNNFFLDTKKKDD